MKAWPSFYDWAPHSKHAAHYERLARAGSPPVTLALSRDAPPGDYPDPPVPEFLIRLPSASVVNRARVDHGAGAFPFDAPGAFTVAPPDTATQTTVEARFDVMAVTIPKARIATLCEDARARGPADFGPLHHRPVVDTLSASLIRALATEPGGSSDAMFVDHAVATLFLRLHALSHGSPPRAKGARLSPEELAAVTARMLDQLEDCPSLADLAAELDMPEHRFARAFKHATGLPPYRWLQMRRVERACELLARTDDAIADIAYACGFSSQAHMTHVFSKRMGVTPAKLRKQMQG